MFKHSFERAGEPRDVSAITLEVLESLEPERTALDVEKRTIFELTDGRIIEVPYPMTSDEFLEEVDLQSGCLWSELETEFEFSPTDANKNLAFIREECSFEPSPFDNIEFPDVFDAYGEWA